MQSIHVDPTATIAPPADLNESTIVEYGCRIGPQVKTSLNVHIHPHTLIQGEVTIGPCVEIGSDTILVGPLEIQEHVRIGRSVMIGSELAADSLLPVGTLAKYTRIGDDAVVLSRLSLGEYSIVSKGARLEGDLPHHGVAWGRPAALKGFACECGRLYTSFNKISPHLFLARCHVCNEPGYRIASEILNLRQRTLLPNQQAGPSQPESFFQDLGL